MPAATGDGIQLAQSLVSSGESDGGHMQEVTNPAFCPAEDPVQTGTTPDSILKPPGSLSADMLPPLTLSDFPSLDELDSEWLTWDGVPIDVKTFYQSYDLPQVVKVDDGDYSNFGMGTHVDVQRPFLLYSSRRCSKVLVANIYWDDSKQQYVEVGPRVVIPVNYPGWFYFLQDSGAVGKTLRSIAEVVALKPKAFLVRSAVPCFRRAIARPKPKSNKPSHLRVYIRDQLSEGELLNFESIQSECVEQTKPSCCICWLFGKKTTTFVSEEQYLRCTDLDGKEVLLDLGLTGQFSPIGEPGTSSEDSVYQLADVVKSNDLPVHMKLCWGQPPSSPCSFTGLLRLEDVYHEETVIACTLGAQRHFMVEFPTDSDIKFIIATDAYRYFDHPVIQKAMKHCEEHIDSYVNSIKVVQSFYPEHVKIKDTKGKEDGKLVRSLPPLPGQEPIDTSQDESVDTTDFTDDSDFSDYSENDENESRHHSAAGSRKTSRRASRVKISDIVNYDDNYEEIPGVGLQKRLPTPPPPEPFPNDIIPPPPPMFAEPSEETDQIQPLPTHANYSIVKIQRTTSHPETVPLNNDIIAPPQSWSDAGSEVSRPHQKLTVSFSDSANHIINNGRPGGEAQNGQSMRRTVDDSLGRELRERLDAFLSDSVQELNRLQSNGESHNGRDTPMSSVSADHNIKGRPAPRVPPKPRMLGRPPQALQSQEDVNAFLETIFDADSMTAENQRAKLHSGTMPHPKNRPVSAEVGLYNRSIDDSFQNKRPQYRAGHPEATLRRHNIKSLSLVQNTQPQRPNHLPVQHPHTQNYKRQSSGTPPVVPVRTTPTLISSNPVMNGHSSNPRENIFIPIRRPESSSPLQDNSSGEYPPSPEQELVTNRADSGIFVSPRMSDFHLELESPYRAPSEDPTWAPPDDLSPLSVTDIAHCLRYIGMKDKVVFRFVEEQIDGKLLLELDAALLREGFPELNALERKKVLDFVGGWRPKKL